MYNSHKKCPSNLNNSYKWSIAKFDQTKYNLNYISVDNSKLCLLFLRKERKSE